MEETPTTPAEALTLAAEIIDAQARYIVLLEKGRWKDGDVREEIETKLPLFRKYTKTSTRTHA